jgi:hypothetical protein
MEINLNFTTTIYLISSSTRMKFSAEVRPTDHNLSLNTILPNYYPFLQQGNK